MQLLFFLKGGIPVFDFFRKGLINKKTLLILNYSKLSITENQLAIILIIMELSNEEQKNFTPSQLSKYMSIEKSIIEKEINNLLVNNLIKLEQKGKKTSLDFTPLFNKIIVKLEEENSNLTNDTNYLFIEELIGRKLEAKEIELIISYIEKGISKPKLLSIIINNNITTFEDLLKTINDYIKKNNLKLTRYNWLND